MYMYGFYGFDYTYFIFIIPALIISFWAQLNVKRTFDKYSRKRSTRGLTGADAASKVLNYNEVFDVEIRPVAGDLTDNFNPSDNSINLSRPVYGEDSIAAIGVAAHEAGHAVQYAKHYAPLKMRSALVPVSRIGSTIAFPLIFIGLMLPLQYNFIVNIGIAAFSLAVIFQLITLPVELDASRRALKTLEQSGTLYEEELQGAKKVLTAAALTYLAATFASILSLLRILLIANGRNRD